jgi:hypothetical protein
LLPWSPLLASGEPLPEPIAAIYNDGVIERLEIQQLALSEARDLLDVVLGGKIGEDTVRLLWGVECGQRWEDDRYPTGPLSC